MLESLVSALLNKFLGAYIENFDPTQLNVGIWNGDVKLKNLRLRKDALDALDLPIDVSFGQLGELTLYIPWSSLKNKPVKVVIEDVYVVCTPRSPESYNVEEELERELRLKFQKLAELEILESSRPDIKPGSPQNETFTQSLLTKIVDNLQVTLKNIHLRYEDTACIFSENPVAVGVSLSELSAVSTDEDWNPSFISFKQHVAYKLITLESICIYCNTSAHSIMHEQTEEVVIRMRESIADGGEIPEQQYILKPVRGFARLKVNKLGSTQEIPHVDAQLVFQELAIMLDDCQYKEMLHNMSKYHWFHKTMKYRRLRPSTSYQDDPVGWFKFAAQSVLDEIHQKNYKWSWAYIKERREKRDKYVSLWRKKLALPSIENELTDLSDEKELKKLQDELSFEDIKFFRALARNQYSKESRIKKLTEEIPSTNSAQSWLSTWWNSPTGKDNSLVMTAEQRRELYDAIEYDETKELKNSIDLPKDRVTMRISNLLKKGSFTIMDRTKGHTMCDFIFEDCATEFSSRPNSFIFKFELSSFLIEDGSPRTLYKHLVSPRCHEDKSNEPLLQLTFDSAPLDDLADSYLNLTFGSVFIYYHVHFINELVRFFNPPTKHWETVSALMNAAEVTVEGWTTQTRMGLEALLDEHKTINLLLNAASPTIIIPLDPHSWDSPCAVIDAGSIQMESDLVPKQEIKKIKEMSVEEYAKIDSMELQRLMFDRFNVRLSDTQLLIGPDMRSSITSINVQKIDNNFTILERIELNFTLDVLIFPKAFNLPKIKTVAKLPNLNLFLNDYQYKVVMQLLEKCIPAVDDNNLDSFDESTSFSFFDEAARDNSLTAKQKQNQLLKQSQKLFQEMSDVEVNQVQFQLELEVSKSQISLLKCCDGKTMTSSNLVTLVSEELSLRVLRRFVKMETEISLEALWLEDHIIAEQEPKTYIISTNNDQEKKLFSLHFVRTQRILEFSKEYYEVFDQNINLRMSELTLFLRPKSVLTLLSFILNTFTDPESAEFMPAISKEPEEVEISSPGKINFNILLDGFNVVLNDEASKIATLSLQSSEVSMNILPESMKIKGKLGSMKLIDETTIELPRTSVFREIISHGEEDLAEFLYETFDPDTNAENYNSFLYYRTGFMRINFVEHSVNKILNFFSKFQKMKSLFDIARMKAYDQTPDIDVVNNIKLDIKIRAPSLSFPKLVDPRKNIYDHMTWNMGDLYISNSFDIIGGKLINSLVAGIQNAQLLSTFNFDGNVTQNISAVNNLDLKFELKYIPKDPDNAEGRAVLKIDGYFAPFFIDLTDLQLQYLYILSQRMPHSFIISEDDDDLEEIELAAIKANQAIYNDKELYVDQSIFLESDEKNEEKGIKLDFNFDAPSLSLSLFSHTAGKASLNGLGITKITVENFGLLGSANEDDGTAFKTEFHIKSFMVEDIRESKDNKHTQLLPSIEGQQNQFMSSIKRITGNEKDITVIEVCIDSPKVILALDFLFELNSFLDLALDVKLPADIRDIESTIQISTTEDKDNSILAMSTKSREVLLQYSINVVDAAIILLADPSDVNSEAVVFTTEQLLISDKNILSLSLNNIGLFLSRMNESSDSRVRILDDFSASMIVDARDSTESALKTDIHASIGPLLLRLSLRDIRLAIEIFNNAISLARDKGLISETSQLNADDIATKYGQFSKEFKNKIRKYAPSMISSLSEIPRAIRKTETEDVTQLIGKTEQFHLDMAGLRMVLIGDVHELPIVDFNISSFSFDLKDWSTNIDALTSIEIHANAFNYSRSSWEPLVEPFPVTFHISKDEYKGNALLCDIIAQKNVEVTLSARTIALLTKIPEYLQEKNALSTRGSQKPYLLFNNTGLTLSIWVKCKEDRNRKKKSVTLSPDETIDWEFEDWREVRETLDTGRNIFQLCFTGLEYTNKIEVDADSEGDSIYKLIPPVADIHARLLITRKLLENNVKSITFSSPLLIENLTSTVVEVLLRDDKSIVTIEPHSIRAIPVQFAYDTPFALRPASSDDHYNWCQKEIFWTDIKSSPISLSCKNLEDSSSFNFEVECVFDADDPLTKIYPRMKIVISAPIILENLLPYDLLYSLWDKDKKRDESQLLRTGDVVPMHSVSLDSFLIISVRPTSDEFEWSKETIINCPNGSEMRPEYRALISTTSLQKIYLNLKYHSSGARAKMVSIYAPYIILNKTGHDLSIFGDRKWGILKSEAIYRDGLKYTTPKLFSFQYEDNRNRAKLKFPETNPSIPLSLDAIGQPVDISLNVLNRNLECNLGIQVKEGDSKYRFSKIVEISPRYLVKNSTSSGLELMEYGSTNPIYLDCSEALPLYRLKKVINKKFLIRFAKGECSWSNPFGIKDVGETYVKVSLKNAAQHLLKMDITLEGATLFINIFDSDHAWPFSIRNFSDEEFLFWQRNPRFLDDEVQNYDLYYQEEEEEVDFEPIYYRIPPRSVMPYSWDYPSAKQKKLYIHCKNRRRELDLNEIGNLRPMRIPMEDPELLPSIVDINILMDNGVQALVLSNYNQEQSLYKLRSQRNLLSNSSFTSNTTEGSEKFEIDEEMDSKLNLRIVLSFSGVGISLINHHFQELCYLNVLGLEFRFNDSEMYQNCSFKMKWIQLDNQLFGGVYDTILYPTKIPKDLKEIEVHPALSGAFSKVKDDSSTLLNFKLATLLLQEMTIQIDEDFLMSLIEFAKVSGTDWNKDYQTTNDRIISATPILMPEFPPTIKSSQVYFEVLHLQPTLLHLSFVRTERVNVEDDQKGGNSALDYFVNVLTMALGNIEDAQIRLNSLLLEHVRVSSSTLITAIQSHYAQQFFYQLHKILGSADFLGNPVGFFNNISSGVMDIFYEPYQGYIMNDRPQELGIGIAKGGLSFLKKSLFGLSDSVAKFTGSVAKGLSVAIQDSSFQERRRLQQRQRGKFGSLGIGASSFLSNVGSGITGVALDPYSGGAKEGAFGFIKGVGRGLIGLPAKTAIGVLDLASNVSEGIKNSTTLMDGGKIERVRLPRFINSDKLIKPYNLRESQGQYWLKSCNGGQYAKDSYVGHVICETPSGFQIVIVSLQRIIRMQLATLAVMEHIPFHSVRNVRVVKTGITVYTSEREYFFSIPKDEERRYLYKLVHTAVTEFNAKWQISP